jgi:Ca-activated chloride channel family protein
MGATRAARAQGRLEAWSEGGVSAGGGWKLASESLRVRIDQQYARSTLEQAYLNQTGTRLEGRYLLSLGEGARVDGFAYWNGETKIVGEVFEKEVAQAIYEEVTGLGRDPGLLEQVGEGTFSFRVFPIEDGERKRVEVRYGRRLRRVGSTLEYRAQLGAEESDVLVEIRDERRILDVHSPSHSLTVERVAPGLVRVRTAKGHGELALRYTVEETPWALSAQVHRDAGQDAYVAIQLATPHGAARAPVLPKDVTLVIDRSGSMSGQPIQQARLAALAVAQRLRPQDRVNVVVFDDGVDQLYARPRLVTEEIRAEALAYIRRIQEGGGTDIGQALARALASQEIDAQPDVILFLTDGQSDAQQALAAAKQDPHDARVFTIGVGTGVQKPLLSRVASLKRGRFTHIENPQTIEAHVSRLFDQIESPVLVDVSVEIRGGALSRVYPRTLPDLTVGDELALVGRAIGQGDLTISLSGTLGGKPVTFSTRVAMPASVSRPWVAREWAKARTDDLLEEMALRGEEEELKSETIELALAYNFVTPYTSFLAIPERELDDSTRDAITSARDRKRQIREAHKDALALSRSDMPPGDPVLTVRGPRDAVQVTAYFPFGLVKDLHWDEQAEAWQVRFLVPKSVRDGVYQAKVVILGKDGTVELGAATYTIDSAEPGFEVEVEQHAGGVTVRVASRDSLGLVTVAHLGDSGRRTVLADRGDGVYEGFLPLPSGAHQLRVVVADTARNEAEEVVSCSVWP